MKSPAIAIPDPEKRWSDHEHPNELKRLLTVLGAEVIDFPLETHCCGGHMTQIGPETAFELIRRLVSAADQDHADLMATVSYPLRRIYGDSFEIGLLSVLVDPLRAQQMLGQRPGRSFS